MPGSCSLGFAECKLEGNITLVQLNQAYKVAEVFSVKNSPYGVPTYPYVFVPRPTNDTIHMEMGKDAEGKRIVALFTIKKVPDRPGALVHVAVFLMDEKLAAQQGVEPEFCATPTSDVHYHAEALKHFRGQLLRLDLGVSNGYLVPVPNLPPPPEDQELPPPPDFEDTL